MPAPLRFLVVDDSAIFRKVMSDVLRSLPNVEVVGAAANGQIALDRLDKEAIDAVTLDLEMPVLGGLETLRRLKAKHLRCEAIVVTAVSEADRDHALAALEIGAVDFVTKPRGDGVESNIAELRAQLERILPIIWERRLRGVGLGTSVDTRSLWPEQPSTDCVVARTDIVCIGVSTGGPAALAAVIPALPKTFGTPVVVVQHMPPLFTASLAESLARKSQLRVVEACDGARLERGVVYIAPGGFHMRVDGFCGRETAELRITDDPPENHCRPAVDYLFRSVARVFGENAIGVIMTGMGQDGVSGLREMKAVGARTIAQDPSTCVVPNMPKEAMKAGVIDRVAPLDEIAQAIVDWVGGGAR